MKWVLQGFLLSLLLTLGSYAIVATHLLSTMSLIYLVAALSTIQIVGQFVLFLRLGQESAESGPLLGEPPRWNVIFFLFTVLIALVVVIGSIWIMYNLDYRM